MHNILEGVIDWSNVRQKCDEKLGELEASVMQAAKTDGKVAQAWGQYDGFRQAIELIESLVSKKE